MTPEQIAAGFDPYAMYRAKMRLKHGSCGPYRLGIAVALDGSSLPPPAHYKPVSQATYRKGFQAGLAILQEQPHDRS